MKRVLPAILTVLGLTVAGALAGAIFGEPATGAIAGFLLALVLVLPVVVLGTEKRSSRQTLRSFFKVFQSGSGWG